MFWQSMGGQQAGSIWGHGAYVALIGPGDWLLNREAVWLLDHWRRSPGGKTYAQPPGETSGRVARTF